jgi:hypothetical protein
VPVLLNARLTPRAHNHAAKRADIPQKHYDRVRTNHPGLYEHMMGELYPHGGVTLVRTIVHAGEQPVVRALLSDRFELIDNVDVLTTLLSALTNAGLGAETVELTGDFDEEAGSLRMRVVVPAIAIAARELVAHYRSPFDGRSGQELPMIFAGVEISNSETGGGAYQILPRAVLQVCRNGMTRNVGDEKFRRVHLGARLESGVINWSAETRRKQLDLLGSAAEDAIRTFISPEYLAGIVATASAAASIEVQAIGDAMARLVTVAQLTDDEADAVLAAFTRSSDLSVLGLAHAVTAHAQAVESSDRQSELEQAFWTIVENANSFAGAS